MGVGCHFHLQGIFPTQGSNPRSWGLLHWQVDSLPLRHPGSQFIERLGLIHPPVFLCHDQGHKGQWAQRRQLRDALWAPNLQLLPSHSMTNLNPESIQWSIIFASGPKLLKILPHFLKSLYGSFSILSPISHKRYFQILPFSSSSQPFENKCACLCPPSKNNSPSLLSPALRVPFLSRPSNCPPCSPSSCSSLPAPPPTGLCTLWFHPVFPSRGCQWTLLWRTFFPPLIDLASPWHLTGLVTASKCFSPTLASQRFSPAGPPLWLLIPSVLWILLLCPLLNAGVPHASLGLSSLFLQRHELLFKSWELRDSCLCPALPPNDPIDYWMSPPGYLTSSSIPWCPETNSSFCLPTPTDFLDFWMNDTTIHPLSKPQTWHSGLTFPNLTPPTNQRATIWSPYF